MEYKQNNRTKYFESFVSDRFRLKSSLTSYDTFDALEFKLQIRLSYNCFKKRKYCWRTIFVKDELTLKKLVDFENAKTQKSIFGLIIYLWEEERLKTRQDRVLNRLHRKNWR